MSKVKPSSITIEEAVARMVNMDYIPTGFSLLDMTDAFREEAEVEYENARIDRAPEEQIATMKVRMESCLARHSLTQVLFESLQREIKNPESSIIPADDSSSQLRLTLESVSEWAADKFGIGIPEWSSVTPVTDTAGKSASWKDVTIKIYADYRLAFNLGDGEWHKSSFQEIGLMGKRKHQPNWQGGILIGLSEKKKFPAEGKYVENKNASAISKLRNALKKLTNISEDPFLLFNEHDGWMPRFKLDDDRNNAAERAKKKAKNVSYEDSIDYSSQETRDFDIENDEAQKWLDED